MDKRNILLITTDQQRFDTINAAGNRHIYTPHLNWLADEGITFSRCYSDCPICMPARATIMTGKHGFTHGLVNNRHDQTPLAEHETLPGILTRNGYQTRAQGKMHFEPMRANYGFEHMELLHDYYREKNSDPRSGLPMLHGLGQNEIEPVISTVNEQNSLTHWTVKRSIDFLETRDATRPFFLWTSFAKPHPPFDPCANYWELYRDKDLPAPVTGSWSETVEEMPQGYLRSTYLLNNAYRLTAEQLIDMKRAYYACITQIDYSLGLLFARMRELGLLENTWIFFTSDHGDMLGDHHMGAKTVFLEGSAHVPMLVRPPQNPNKLLPEEEKTCSTLISLADIMPAILNIAGCDAPEDLDGTDMLEYVGRPAPDRAFYGNSGNLYFSLIDGKYKYMWTALGGDELLFDLAADPCERNNLAETEPEMNRQLRAKLTDYLARDCGQLVKDGRLQHQAAPRGPGSVPKWPGHLSAVIPSDVLH